MIAVIPAVSAGRNSEQRRKKHAESENLRQGQNITGNSFHGGIFHGEEIYGTLLLAAVAENINFTGGWGGQSSLGLTSKHGSRSSRMAPWTEHSARDLPNRPTYACF